MVRAPIIEGSPDPASDAVMLSGHASMMCTATLITPDLLLTARHCLAVSPGASPTCPIEGAPTALGELHALDDVLLYSADDLGDPAGQYLAVSAIHSLPNGDIRPSCGADIVAIELATPTDISPVVPSFARVTMGEQLSVIGFGNSDPSNAESAGQRRRKDDAHVIHIGARASDILMGVTGMGMEDFAIDRGPCGGDSGGPALNRDGELIGVMSRGDRRTCENMVYTSIADHGEWIRGLGRASAERLGLPAFAWASELPPDADGGSPVNDAAMRTDGGPDDGGTPGDGGEADGGRPADGTGPSCSIHHHQESHPAPAALLTATLLFVRRRRRQRARR